MSSFEEEVKSKIPDVHIRTMLNIRHTAHFFSTISDAIMKPYGITSPQYNILRILRGAGEPITIGDVKDRMIEKSPNATRLMDKLCDKEYISRVRCDHDRRAVYVSITAKGLKVLDEISFDEIDRYIYKLSKEEMILLGSLLDKLRSGES